MLRKFLIIFFIMSSISLPTHSNEKELNLDDKNYHHLLVGISQDQVETINHRLEQSLYEQVVKNLIINCVDVFVYDPNNHTYLLVKRGQKPAQGMWWVPGGRQQKGESFFDAAKRKCKEELSIDIEPLYCLTNYSTIFPDSEWQTQTHTVNQVIFAVIKQNSFPKVDPNHDTWQWIDISESPNNSNFFANQDDYDYTYVQNIYDEAITYLAKYFNLKI